MINRFGVHRARVPWDGKKGSRVITCQCWDGACCFLDIWGRKRHVQKIGAVRGEQRDVFAALSGEMGTVHRTCGGGVGGSGVLGDRNDGQDIVVGIVVERRAARNGTDPQISLDLHGKCDVTEGGGWGSLEISVFVCVREGRGG